MRPTARLLTGTALAAASIGPTSLYAASTATARTTATTVTAATAATTLTTASGAIAADNGDRLELSPKVARPGSLVSVRTDVCREGTGRGEARSAGAGEFRLERSTDQEVLVGRFRVPHEIRRGSYRVGVRCEDGRVVTREFFVEHGREPRGHVRSGTGGSVGPDVTQIAVGAAVVAAAAVGGTLHLRRRASGAQDR
ncbi:hypothetical protein AB0O64_25245 [Streptomyces sp. NPDC088341]|uniref:hypothetical protein n=1 Tax=Streptomyces sp. NPDC088341 TaxID=3154870 RepID=UPI0034270DD7